MVRIHHRPSRVLGRRLPVRPGATGPPEPLTPLSARFSPKPCESTLSSPGRTLSGAPRARETPGSNPPSPILAPLGGGTDRPGATGRPVPPRLADRTSLSGPVCSTLFPTALHGQRGARAARRQRVRIRLAPTPPSRSAGYALAGSGRVDRLPPLPAGSCARPCGVHCPRTAPTGSGVPRNREAKT